MEKTGHLELDLRWNNKAQGIAHPMATVHPLEEYFDGPHPDWKRVSLLYLFPWVFIVILWMCYWCTLCKYLYISYKTDLPKSLHRSRKQKAFWWSSSLQTFSVAQAGMKPPAWILEDADGCLAYFTLSTTCTWQIAQFVFVVLDASGAGWCTKREGLLPARVIVELPLNA